jgi:DNA-binding NtrC family response regulator
MTPAENPTQVAVIDDDPDLRRLLRTILESRRYAVVEFGQGADAVAGLDPETAVVCLDLGLGQERGLDVLVQLRARHPDLPVIIVTAAREIETAVNALRSGAHDYVVKPIEPPRFLQAVANAAEQRRLVARVRDLEEQLTSQSPLATIVSGSAPMKRVMSEIARVGRTDVPVCVLGESGTGKELVARALAQGSPRARGPFIGLNCAAIAPSLLESELFGHEKGAFTGAAGSRAGCFEQAQGGTLFLDEVGEMSPALQASLLRALQEKSIRRVGGTRDVAVDVRIICATHRDLEAEVAAGRFRQDLYFRLVVYPLRLPPLRERRDDIPALVAHLIRKHQTALGHGVLAVSPTALEALTRYGYPGNVRELENVLQRALIACDGEELHLHHLPVEIQQAYLPALATEPVATAEPQARPPVLPLKEVERRTIEYAMEVAKGNVTEAARLLEVGRATLYRYLASQSDKG